jgi:integrase
MSQSVFDSRPDPSTIVLRSRELRAGTDPATPSRFGDDRWHVAPADPDAHTHHSALHWHGHDLPGELVDQVKAFAFAMLDRPTPQILHGAAAGDMAAVGTVRVRARDLLVFAAWIDELGIKQFRDVTNADLDRYLEHVKTLPRSPNRQAALLSAVRTLWVYSCEIDSPARLELDEPPWGGELPNQLIGAVVRNRVNRIPRISPDTMQALLAWSLQTLENAGPDIAAAWDAFPRFNDGQLPFRDDLDGLALDARLALLLDHYRREGRALPGRIDQGRAVVNFEALGRLLGIRHAEWTQPRKQHALASGLPIVPDTYLREITGRIDGELWRSTPIGTGEIRKLVRLLTTACFIVVCYLSGARPGEVLNLRRGCSRVDPETGELQISGRRGKGRGRANPGAEPAQQRTWTVVAPVHAAISMLEQLTTSSFLFPASAGRAGMPSRPNGSFARAPGAINRSITEFIAWINDSFTGTGTPAIPPDPVREIHAARFRRTLAYFIVRRRRGLIAAALQYGHVSTKVTLSYSGMADTGWLDDLALERLELVLEQAERDRDALDGGENVSGPSAADYRTRVAHAARFAGRVVNTPRAARRLLEQADPNIHHGDGMTCVWRKETALCRKVKLDAGLPADDAPDESECRTACQNLAYTDRDVTTLRSRAQALEAAAADTLAPHPIRTRLANQAEQLHRIIARHNFENPAEER